MLSTPVKNTTPDFRALFSRRATGLPADPLLDSTEDVVNRISFTFGFPDPASLPAADVAAATVRAMERNGQWALQYGDNAGYRGLVSALLAKLERDQGIVAGPENVLITAGASQAIDLVLDAFVDWGDTFISEMPIWPGGVQAFRHVGASVVPIPVDRQGTDTEALARELARLRDDGVRPKFIYVIPNFQNPSGVTMSLERRRRLIELARAYETPILEDDAYFDLRFEGEQLPTIYGLDGGGSTLYMGTLSKTMGAGMRLGWLVGPPAVIHKLTVLKVDGATNVFGSHVAAEWLPRHLDAHVDLLRSVYRRRRDAMLAALAEQMPSGVAWTRPEGGFFVWVTLPEGIDTGRMLVQAKERGVEYLPGSACFVEGGGRNMLRLAFSYATEDQIETGIRILGEVIDGELLELR